MKKYRYWEIPIFLMKIKRHFPRTPEISRYLQSTLRVTENCSVLRNAAKNHLCGKFSVLQTYRWNFSREKAILIIFLTNPRSRGAISSHDENEVFIGGRDEKCFILLIFRLSSRKKHLSIELCKKKSYTLKKSKLPKFLSREKICVNFFIYRSKLLILR